jgi:aquaporin Z
MVRHFNREYPVAECIEYIKSESSSFRKMGRRRVNNKHAGHNNCYVGFGLCYGIGSWVSSAPAIEQSVADVAGDMAGATRVRSIVRASGQRPTGPTVSNGGSMNKYLAEFFGTFWLVLGGCGSAVLAAAFPNVGIGLLGVALAFGLTVLTMAFAIGHISGCHLNPAVSVGLWAGGRFPAKDLAPYIGAQVLGGLVAGGVLFVIASGKAGFDLSAGFASNGYGAHSPGEYSMLAALVTEVVMTMMFLLVILGATDKRAPAGFAPIAIGLCLTLIHLISIPVTNTSVNPARSTAVAVYVGGWALGQLWLFWVAPIIGGLLGAVVYRFIGNDPNA